MKNTRFMVSLVLLASLLGAFQAMGQTVVRHAGGEEGNADILLLHELGIVVGMPPGASDLQVLVLMPDADPKLTIKKDDLVLMINGKRVKDMDSLRAEYESAAVGDEVKIGFRRGDERFLSSFEKKNEEASGGGQRMVMIGGPGGDFDDLQPVHEFGAVLGEKDGQVVVAMRLPMDEAALDEGDVVQSINGTAVSSLKEFRAVYEPLAVGDAVEVVALRDGDEISLSMTKSRSQGQIRVRRGP